MTQVVDGCHSYLGTTTGVNLTTLVPANQIVKYTPRVAVMMERRAMPLVSVSVGDMTDRAIAINGRGGLRDEQVQVAVDVMYSMTHQEPADDQEAALELIELVGQKLRFDPSWGFLTDGGRAGLDLSGRWMQDPVGVVQEKSGVLWWRWTTTAHLHPLAG